MVRYYGYYSNVRRGKRKRQNLDELIPTILESDESSRERRKNWARLIQNIYEMVPLTCPKCSGTMKVISVIEDQDVIKKILQRRTSPQTPGIMGSESQTPSPDDQDAAPSHQAPYRLFGVAGPPFR
ncbi:MAG: hypothetical protein JW836_16035 [Deltaproteobacteria bacterium]|nr:hypothetical protein [Deltaproteobacteria bacterium]